MIPRIGVSPQAAERAQAALVEHCSERQREALSVNALSYGFSAPASGFSVIIGEKHYEITMYGSTVAIVTRGDVTRGPLWRALVGTRMSWLPAADCMLAAKLLLEADEQAFVRAGNKCGNIWLD